MHRACHKRGYRRHSANGLSRRDPGGRLRPFLPPGRVAVIGHAGRRSGRTVLRCGCASLTPVQVGQGSEVQPVALRISAAGMTAVPNPLRVPRATTPPPSPDAPGLPRPMAHEQAEVGQARRQSDHETTEVLR
ncbi:hypothetical protein GCM10009760_49590 [Kitasatospora kazusensis]|uniref:Uncharacterized protein n=1 Tax=Kitasatospora kazusensis TaxID=407974 RepID=A0ABN3A2L2_9ACTN